MPSRRSRCYNELEPLLDRLLEDYRDLQASTISRLETPPTPLEALRMIYTNHPTIIQGCNPFTSFAEDVNWDEAESYASVLGDGEISIAITDDGYADSVRTLQGGATSFVKPLEENMPIKDFLSKLRDPTETEIMYLQSQDGNIYRSHPRPGGDELEGMRKYIKRDIDWMAEAVGAYGGLADMRVGESAEAVNLWIGSSRSVTSLHHDPYENIYHVLSGTKTFTLVSPIEGLWLNQTFHPPSTLQRRPSSRSLQPILDEPPAHPVPWVQSSDIPPPIQPIVVTLRKGETLYLPRGWWHRVEQASGVGGLAVAVNYWYNSTIHPASHALERLSQRIARKAGREGVIPVDIDSDGESDDGGQGDREVDEGVPEGVWAEDSGSGEEWEPSEWGR